MRSGHGEHPVDCECHAHNTRVPARRRVRAAGRQLRNLSVISRFMLIGTCVGVLVAAALGWYLDVRATDLVLDQVAARARDQIVLATPGHISPDDLEPPFPAAKLEDLGSRLDPLMTRLREADGGLIQLNLWARDRTLLYSDVPGRVGLSEPSAEPAFQEALAGQVGKEVSSLNSPEHADLRAQFDGALEVYVPVRFAEQVLGVYEVYQDLGPIRPVRPLVWGAVSAGFLLLLLALFAVVRGAARTIREQQSGTVFLAHASAELTRSLNVASTLQSLARLAVPALGEACVVDMVQTDGSLGRLLTAQGSDEGECRMVDSGPPQPLHPCERGKLGEVLRTQHAMAYAFEPELSLSCPAVGAAASGDTPGTGWRWAMSVPLVVRDQVLGVFTCFRSNPRGEYSPTVVALAQDLAGRCALALENARLYQEAQTAVRARDEFLSIAAHELKTPTTSVLGFAQLLLRRLDGGEAIGSQWVRGTLGTIEHQAQRLSQLVVQLLDVSRVEAGKLVLDRRPTDLAPLVETVVSAARLRTTDHQLLLHVAGPTPAIVDALRFEQVLANLLDNAIKFSPAGGQIEIELGPSGRHQVRLAVRDHGVGIAHEKQGRIFERLYQAHEGDPLTRAAGMGLGLYISRHIVELHGGRIDAETPSDSGTRLVVILPTDQATSGVPAEASAIGPSSVDTLNQSQGGIYMAG